MAKILVADDNSNVQKTVSLALADLSVEVASVNNGEAAVRKLADIAPDLILADIFMPVRNGYEVCEFVKKDPRFAHVPVVLLVGAFDPLDEREAQRVGADGILKKPFVPPDPLIAMVKTLLDRSMSDRLVPVGAAKPAAMQQGKSGGVAVDEQPPAPPAAPSASRTPEPAEEIPVQEFPLPLEPVSFGEGERPIAFGQLLETPPEDSAAHAPETMEPVDDTQVMTSSRDASLGEPIFWKTEEPEPVSDEESAESDEELSSEAPMRPWTPEGQAAAHADAAVVQSVQPVQPVQPVEPAQPVEAFELVREEQEPAQASSLVASGSLIAPDAASQASLTVQSGKAEDLAANPIEWMASVPPPPAEEAPAEAAADWSATVSDPEDTVDAMEAEVHRSAEEAVPSVPPAAAAPVANSPSPIALPSLSSPAASDAPPAQKTAEAPNPNKTQPSIKPIEQNAEDTARSIPKQEWADLAATLLQRPGEPVAEKPKAAAPPAPAVPAAPAANPQPAPASVTQNIAAGSANAQASATTDSSLPPTPDPALVEAVVQRVLDKMRPQVVDIITKEFLRPVVQALVHREITKR